MSLTSLKTVQMEEVWKEIKDYPMYEISSLGRVRSYCSKSHGERRRVDIPKILSNKIDRIGYSFIHLNNEKGRRPLRIHRLVAEAFIPNPNSYPEVNHIDENKQNNCISNLEWCTRLQNVRHSKVWESVKREVNQYDSEHNLIKTWYSMSEAARTLKVAPQSIFRAIQKHGKSVGYYWCYA